jgi:hypothetical protein
MSSEPAPKRDVVFAVGPTSGGEGVRVIRSRDDAIEVGEVRAAKEGQPIVGELVKLSPRKEHERLFDVEVLVPRAEPRGAARSGPAQVATAAYRSNWDVIFAAKEPEQLN